MSRFKGVMVVLVSLSVLLGGCDRLKEPAGPGSEEALRQRVTQEWNAKVSKDWGIVYDLAVAEYRKKVSRATFLEGAKLDQSEYSIKEIKILESGKEAAATVTCKLSHMGKMFPFTFEETWLLEDDGWRLALKP